MPKSLPLTEKQIALVEAIVAQAMKEVFEVMQKEGMEIIPLSSGIAVLEHMAYYAEIALALKGEKCQ